MKTASREAAKPRLERGTLNPEPSLDFVSSPETQGVSLNTLHTLINDTRDTGHGWYLSFRYFPTQDIECVALKLTNEDSLRRGGGAKRKSDTKTEMDEMTLLKSQARAKKTIRHKLMMMQADRMLTLTYRENMTDLQSRGWSDIKKFSRLMRETFDDWKYVCVPEFQKRGAVHFHMAIKGYYPVNVVRKIWRQVVGDGNIDITSPKTIGKNSWNPKNIAVYLYKYITKEDSVQFNKRRYSSTQIPPPPVLTGWLALGLQMETFLQSLVSKIAKKETSVWSSDDGYFPIVMVTT